MAKKVSLRQLNSASRQFIRLPLWVQIIVVIAVVVYGWYWLQTQSVSQTAQPTPSPTTYNPASPAGGPQPINQPVLPGFSPTTTVSRVVDGDTIEVQLEGQAKKVRLIGVDSPESVDSRTKVQCFGKEASAKLKKLVEGTQVELISDPTQGEVDRYGRLLRYVYSADQTLINQLMIQQGYAFEYTYQKPYQFQAQFKQAQADASQAGLGLWAATACNGKR